MNKLVETSDLGVRPKVPSNSQMSRMSVMSREQEIPTELPVSMIIEGTSHEARDLMEDTMTRQIARTSFKLRVTRQGEII